MQQIEYDYIIVGGGTAGCIVASRIAENTNLQVLLLEAGKLAEDAAFLNDPARFRETIGSDFDWKYGTYPAGKILGGSSKLNACIFMRGASSDYDSWPDGWKYEDLLPYFKKSENCSFLPVSAIKDNRSHRGFAGPLKLTLTGNNGKNLHPYTQGFLDACMEMGYQFSPDINTSRKEDTVALHQFNIADKARQSVDICYLQKRKNLRIISDTSIAKILFDDKKAIGLTCESGKSYRAKKEIIISAGTLGTPKILMLSGIGNKEELDALGINCIANLPVGMNFQDHHKAPMIFTSSLGIPANVMPCEDSGLQASLLKSGIQITFAINPLPHDENSSGRFSRVNQQIPHNGFALFPAIGIPETQGRARLVDGNISLEFNPYQSPQDVNTMLKAMKISRRIVRSTVFEKFKIKEIIDEEIPHDPASDEYLLAYMKKHSFSQAHASCTCAMGIVVDENLKVKNLQGLRIIDASVFPNIINANIQSTVIAIAEKAAEFIIRESKS